MKSWMRLVAALAACACFSACHRQPDLSRLGSPSQRLVGHWVTNSGDHEYYGPPDASGTGSFILVHAGGKPLEQQYRVIEEDPATQAVRLSLPGADGAVAEQTDLISEDGESAIATATLAGDKVTLAFVRMDDAIAPQRPRISGPESPATVVARYVRSTTASPLPGFPADMPDGQYHRVLVRYDGLKPVYKWEPLTARDKTPLGATFSPSRAVAQHHSYLIWLHATAAAILLITSLLFASELGATALLTGWAVALAIAGIGVFLLDMPLLAGVLEIITGGVLVFRAMFQKSDLLS